jgi:hypothetical protein
MPAQSKKPEFAPVDLEEIAGTGRDLEDAIVLATGTPWDPNKPLPEDGEPSVEDVLMRSLGPAWDRAFRWAKVARHNGNKGSMVFADANHVHFEVGGLYAEDYKTEFGE